MKVQLHDGQKEVFFDTHKYKIINAGRQWGKSVLARIIVLDWATKTPGGKFWIVSPTYVQGKQNHWLQLQKEIPAQWVKKKNEVEMSITLQNDSTIYLKSAENPDSLRGTAIHGLVIDEIAAIKNWTYLWEYAIAGDLVRYDAKIIFISTPQGFNHFYNLYQLGKDTRDGNPYKSWHFTSYMNPHIQQVVIDEQKRLKTEDAFAQEYMADFRKATGVAIKQWNRDIHLIEPFTVPTEWQRGRGFDYGSSDPTASLRIAIDNEDTWFIERCYKERKSTIKDHAMAIRAQDYGQSFIPIYGDPSGDQWEKEFALPENGIIIQSANKEVGQGMRGWVEYSIEVINQRLKPLPGHTVRLPDGREIQNAPKLFVLNTPENMTLVNEIERLTWKQTADGGTMPVLDETVDPDGHSDLVACLRYFVVSYRPSTIADSDFPDDTLMFKQQGLY